MIGVHFDRSSTTNDVSLRSLDLPVLIDSPWISVPFKSDLKPLNPSFITMSTSTMKIRIRDATADDLDQTHAMMLKLKAFLSKLSKPPSLESFKKDSGLISGYKYFHLLVAEDTSSGQLVGYILYYFLYLTQLGKVLYVQDIYTEESVRKSGVGSLLLRRAGKRAKETDSVLMRLQVSSLTC